MVDFSINTGIRKIGDSITTALPKAEDEEWFAEDITILLLLTAVTIWAVPEIQFEEINFDFNTIEEEDGIVKHEFFFQNIGDELLFIYNVKSS